MATCAGRRAEADLIHHDCGMRSLLQENSSGGPRHWRIQPDADMSQDNELTVPARDTARGDVA